MSDRKTKLALVAVVFLLLAIVGYFVARAAIGKYLNSPETLRDIESSVAAGFGGVLTSPGVSIGRISMEGLGGISLHRFRITERGKVLLESKRIVIKCSLLKQILLGSCGLEFIGDFGRGGKVILTGVLPRKL